MLPIYNQIATTLTQSPTEWVRIPLAHLPGSLTPNKQVRLAQAMRCRKLPKITTFSRAEHLYVRLRPEVTVNVSTVSPAEAAAIRGSR